MKIFVILVLILLHSNSSPLFQPYYEEALSIAKSMTLEQKIGQTLQVDFGAIANKSGMFPELAQQYFLGSLLIGGNGAPDANGDLVVDYGDEGGNIDVYGSATMERWQKMSAKFNYTIAVSTKNKAYKIKSILATDAVHNNQHAAGTILFPHNSGLSCSHNPDHFYNLGKWTAKNVKQSGFTYAFAPTVAVSHNPQWGRFYETMGSDSDLIYKYAQQYVEGLQGKAGSLTGVIGSVKHFIGDGATMYGADEGNVHVSDFKTFMEHNVQGYKGAIESSVGTVMCSYSAINWVPMAISTMIPSTLRSELGFDGFVISDYDELGRIIYQHLPTSFQTMGGLDESIASAFNAGIDMMMIPPFDGIKNVEYYFEGLKKAVQNQNVTEERLNDAVARILSVKLAIGLIQSAGNNMKTQEIQTKVEESATSEYEDSLNAVQESLVLLKNDNNLLPFNTEKLQYVVLVGEKIINVYGHNYLYQNFDNIGMQAGGWSLRWQGFMGNGLWKGENKVKTNASSVLDALNGLNQKFKSVYPKYSSSDDMDQIGREREEFLNNLNNQVKNMNSGNTLIIAVVGEPPFAEFAGDVGIPYCQKDGELSGQGCMFNPWINPYLNGDQRESLALQFDDFDNTIIDKVKGQDKDIPLLTVLFSGRPMLIGDILSKSNALLDAFLPGTSGGQGVVNSITGKYVIRSGGSQDRKNSLAFDWPSTSDSLRNFPVYKADGKIPKIEKPLFTEGYGLSTK